MSTFIEDREIKPDFIKIDVEGLEKEVLQGLTGAYEEIDKIFVELHNDANSLGDFEEIYDILAGKGRLLDLEGNEINEVNTLSELDEILWKSN